MSTKIQIRDRKIGLDFNPKFLTWNKNKLTRPDRLTYDPNFYFKL